MLRAVFFDMGGTLDGDGLHWLDRFIEVYAAAGASLPRQAVRAAFDAAERRAATDQGIMSAHLDDMIDRHVRWQLEYLAATHDRVDGVEGLAGLEGTDAERLRREVVTRFVEPIRHAGAVNVQMLNALRSSGLKLGVVSNGCGNVDLLCEDLGYAPFLSVIVDSRRVGLFKPDPAIYTHAAAAIALPAASILMVGDSFERDIEPARSIGMKTAWLEGAVPRPCPDRGAADLTLRQLADLPARLAALAPAQDMT